MRVFSADNSSEQFEEQLEDTVIEKGECKCNRSVRTAGHSLVISRPNWAFRRYAGRIPDVCRAQNIARRVSYHPDEPS